MARRSEAAAVVEPVFSARGEPLVVRDETGQSPERSNSATHSRYRCGRASGSSDTQMRPCHRPGGKVWTGGAPRPGRNGAIVMSFPSNWCSVLLVEQ